MILTEEQKIWVVNNMCADKKKEKEKEKEKYVRPQNFSIYQICYLRTT